MAAAGRMLHVKRANLPRRLRQRPRRSVTRIDKPEAGRIYLSGVLGSGAPDGLVDDDGRDFGHLFVLVPADDPQPCKGLLRGAAATSWLHPMAWSMTGRVDSAACSWLASSSGRDRALSTPSRPARGPNFRAHLPPPSEPARTVRRSRAAVMQGPSLGVAY